LVSFFKVFRRIFYAWTRVFIQKFILFLGQPGLSIYIILFALIIGSGLGSIFIGKIDLDQVKRIISIICLIICVLVIFYNYLLPFFFNFFLDTNFIIRIILAVGIVSFLGLFMGMPFPLWIKCLKIKRLERNIPWMYGINTVSSVLGSAFTMVISLKFGFSESLLTGTFCYFIILIFSGFE